MTAKLLIRQNRLEEAIPFLKKALEFNPEDVVARHNLGKLLYQQGSRAEGIRNLEESLRLQSGSRELLNDLAWMLATAPEDSLRDGKRALELALLADNASGGNDPAILDTLAAAYAESGDYPRALETARRALELAERQGNAALSSSLKEEIARYESGMPCREPQ
jgi:spermidine synthase